MPSEPTPQLPVLDLFTLTGQVALVTGASRGIGAAIALALSQAGAHLLLVFRNPESPTSTLDAIRARGGTASVVYAELSDRDQVTSLFPRALDCLRHDDIAPDRDRIHIFVHAAGIQRRAPAVAFPDDAWDEVISVNLTSAFLLARAAGAHMLPHRSGKIILLASLLTFQGGLTVPAYASAKGGVGQLVKALANEWSAHNVHVNGLVPGYVDTAMNAALRADPLRADQITVRIPAARWGTPDDFAGPAVFLASRASQYVCGELLVVDGGWMGR